MRFGRYRISVGYDVWSQTPPLVAVRRFLCFWLLKEVDPNKDVDKKQLLPVGSEIVKDGRRYRYCKAGENIYVGKPLIEEG